MTDKLLSSFEHEGVWWKPDDPDNKIGGSLSYEPTIGCKLSLLGQFGLYESFGKTDPDAIPVLHGVLKRGGQVTLIDNQFGGGQVVMSGLATEILRPQYALLGDLIDNPENFSVYECRFSLTNLEEWLCHRPFWFEDTSTSLESFQLNVRLPNEQVFVLPHIGAKLKTNASIKTSGTNIREFRIETPSWLELEFNQQQNLKSQLDLISRLRNFASLCLGIRVYISNIVFRGVGEGGASAETRPPHIEIFYAQNPSPEVREKELLASGITIQDFGESAACVFDKWLQLYDKITPSLNVLFAPLYIDMYVEERFLFACQSVEVLHRHLWPASFVDEGEFEEIRNKLIESVPRDIPEDLATKLKGLLKYGNEFSLRRRIKDIADRLGSIGADKIVQLDAAFIDDVVNTRNYYTHYDISLRHKAKNGRDLFRLYSKLVLTAMAVIYSELGAPIELVAERLGRHRQFGRYVGT